MDLCPRCDTYVRGSILISMADVTQIFSQIEHGDSLAAEQLLPLVYQELRNLASAKFANERPGQTRRPRPWSMRPISDSSTRSAQQQTNRFANELVSPC